MSYQSELVHFLTGHASVWVMSQSKNTPCTRADWPRISFALNSACPWRSAARSARSGLAFDQGIHEFGRGATWDSPKTAAAERTTDPSQHRNRLRTGFGLPHFPRAVFEAGLKDPKNDSGRCGSVRLTRPFRNAPNRCPVRDSSQKERPTLEFFSQER